MASPTQKLLRFLTVTVLAIMTSLLGFKCLVQKLGGNWCLDGFELSYFRDFLSQNLVPRKRFYPQISNGSDKKNG